MKTPRTPVADLAMALIHERGPMTVAAFMELALYHEEFGYYTRVVQRSGRSGDFFTSVDVGPLFGGLIARQLVQMAGVLRDIGIHRCALVEAGAGNGRLSADILRAVRDLDGDAFGTVDVHLVEASPAARAAQRETLGPLADRLVASGPALPEHFDGVLVANELLDAMPVHQVIMTPAGLREIYVDNLNGELTTCEGPLSTTRLADHFSALGIVLEAGCRAEVSLAAIDWMREAIRRLTHGFAIIIDYGHAADELYSPAHSSGTLTTFTRHMASGSESTAPAVPWLRAPGEQDLTAHVDFTSARRSAEAEGGIVLGYLDQMYFLLALATDRIHDLDLRQRLALKTLVLPGGLGSTMKVLVIGKGVGTPELIGCPARSRAT